MTLSRLRCGLSLALLVPLAACGGSEVTTSPSPIPPLPADAPLFAPGSAQTVALGPAERERLYRLVVPEGGIVSVSARNHPSSGGSVYVALVHAAPPVSGDRVLEYGWAHAREGVGTISLRRTLSAEQGGEMALFVRAEESAEVELTVEVGQQRDAGVPGDAPAASQRARPIELDATYEGTTGSEDLEDRYRFDVPTSGDLTVSLANTSATAFGCGARLFLGGASKRVEYVQPGQQGSYSVPVSAASSGELLVGCNGDGSYRFSVALGEG